MVLHQWYTAYDIQHIMTVCLKHTVTLCLNCLKRLKKVWNILSETFEKVSPESFLELCIYTYVLRTPALILYNTAMSRLYKIIITMCIHTRKICANCSGCVSDDCGTCVFCQDVTKYGGAGWKKRCCKEKMTGDEIRLHVQIFRSRFVLKLLLYSVFILCNLW